MPNRKKFALHKAIWQNWIDFLHWLIKNQKTNIFFATQHLFHFNWIQIYGIELKPNFENIMIAKSTTTKYLIIMNFSIHSTVDIRSTQLVFNMYERVIQIQWIVINFMECSMDSFTDAAHNSIMLLIFFFFSFLASYAYYNMQ